MSRSDLQLCPMTTGNWRLDPIGNGNLAWLYLIPHAVYWPEPADVVQNAGYTITEEAQTLVDGELGRCLRYLTVRH